MASNKTQLMAQFYEQCQNKGYTNMRDDKQSLKAKVIATDLGLRYGNIVEFYEKAAQCYRQIQKETAMQQQAERAENARRAVNGTLLVTISDSKTTLRVYARPDGTNDCTLNDGGKIEGIPSLSVHKGGSLQYTYHPSETVFTGASSGGIMMGGTHQTEAYYTERMAKSGKGYITATLGDAEVSVTWITMSEYIQARFKRDEQFKALVSNGEIRCIKDSEIADMFARSVLSGGGNIYTQMSKLTMAADAKRLPYETCKEITKLLGRIIHGHFPPTDAEIYDQAKRLAESDSSAQLMRAIETFRKISDYKDANKQIDIVQKRYDEVLQTEKERAILAKEASARRNRKIAAIAVVILLVLGAAAFVFSKAEEENAYQSAIAMMDAGKYEEAIVAFEALDGYKDSWTKISECDIAILDGKYDDAVALMNDGKYEEAIGAFEVLEGHRDSDDKILTCEKAILDSKYSAAIVLMDAGQYDEAITAFEALEGYKGSDNKIKECKAAILDGKYNDAIALMDGGKYMEAIAVFDEMDGYKNSAEFIAECYYRHAIDLKDKKQMFEAAIAFGKLAGYKDARERSFELWNEVAVRETLCAGNAHTVALKNDGTVVAIGKNDKGQCNVGSWKDIVAISAGRGHTVGLKADGTVVATGYDEGGRLNVGAWKDIVAISARGTHTVGLKCDGTVVVAGYNGDGRCNVEDWTDIIAIDAGTYHTVGLKSDGTVIAVGNNDKYQCEVEDWTNIVAVSGGESFTTGLRTDGTVVVTRNNAQYADNGKRNVGNWKNIVRVCAGSGYNLALQNNGKVVSAGKINQDMSGTEKWNNIVAVSVNMFHAVGLRADGTVVATGNNNEGQCNVSAWTNIKLPN